MLRHISLLVMSLLLCAGGRAQVTLQRCVTLAQENYPLIRKYGLLQTVREVRLSDINKSWMPQISVYGQVTAQNATPSLPDALSAMLDGQGTHVAGIDRLQYKLGADISQTIWDGGTSKSRRSVENAHDAERRAALDVQLYAIRERVESLFFGILLVEEQAEQTRAMQALLKASLDKLKAMHRNGTAMQSDVDMVEAQYLVTGQQLLQAESLSGSYRRMLGMFTGEDIGDRPLVRPDASMPQYFIPDRPELRQFEARLRVNEAERQGVTSSLMPKVGLFAQAYYGYPGLDYFENMMRHDLSFNILAGVKVSWNIGALYHKKNDLRSLKLASDDVSVERDVFIFNTNVKAQAQIDRIRELEEVMKENDRIVELRANVRKAAESQLDNGVIDATALLAKLTDEKQARLTASYHEIQLLQSIYQLKYTLNR